MERWRTDRALRPRRYAMTRAGKPLVARIRRMASSSGVHVRLMLNVWRRMA